MDTSTINLGAALLAGLAASGHCAAMCGGIAGALAMRNREAGAAARLANVLAYNLSRVASYAVAGAIAGLLGGALLRAIDVRALSVAFRVLSGLIMVAAAGRVLFGWRLLDPLEAAGSGLWRRVAPLAGRQRGAGSVRSAIGLGLAWGWLPCGITYSMLLLAATSASAPLGAAVMLAFGAGTLPSMTTAGLAFDRVARLLSTQLSLKRVAGLLLLLFGLWTGGYAIHQLTSGSAAHPHHHAGATGS
jgi:sulfite exporter TauE/SafE